jgi:hypothetical protein
MASRVSFAAFASRLLFREILTFYGPLLIRTQAALVAHEAGSGLGITAQLPVQPVHRHLRGGATIGLVVGAAMTYRQVCHCDGNMVDQPEVFHAILIGNVGRSTQYVENGRVIGLHRRLGYLEAGHGSALTVIGARVLHDQGLHARVTCDQSRLQASTTEARDSHLLRINAPEIRAALTGILGQRPVNGFGEIRCLGLRERLSLRGRGMCTRATEYATRGNHQITVGRQLEQVKAGAGPILRTAAVSPGDHSQFL